MSVTIVEHETRFTGRDGTVVLESEVWDELEGQRVKEFALEEAVRRGLATPGIADVGNVYPTGMTDPPPGQQIDLAAKPGTKYRRDIRVMSSR